MTARAQVDRRPTRVRWGAILAQVVGVAAFLGLLAFAAATAWVRMRQQGVAYGFDVLLRPTGFTVASPFLEQAASDPYWWTFVVAFVDTAVVGLLSIVLSTTMGFAIGVGLLARNALVRTYARLYVDVFRNIPLVLQAVFWYVTFTSLPTPRSHPPSLFGLLFLSNKGLSLPLLGLAPDHGPAALVDGVALLALAACFVWRRSASRPAVIGAAGLAMAALAVNLVRAWPLTLDRPRPGGFAIEGGLSVPIELMALTFAIVVFSSAYVAEIVRGGLLSVPKGQSEAALSLGLPGWVVFSRVDLPIALRSMMPPLGNQFIFTIKSTALGIAVGYPDLFAVGVVSISATGQAIEFLVLMMAVYFALNFSVSTLVNAANRALAFPGTRS